jgi:two-component system sensor histidine kinase KdpD
VANLLSNALKYGTGGSPIEVRTTAAGEMVTTSVSDDGPGVPSGDRERIFDKLTRLGDHLTRAEPGVGLGLYIARRAVERMGGEIWCDDRPGGGARFSFTLPAAVPVRPPAAPRRRQPLGR